MIHQEAATKFHGERVILSRSIQATYWQPLVGASATRAVRVRGIALLPTRWEEAQWVGPAADHGDVVRPNDVVSAATA
jgi:hypothetical protein